MRYLFHSVFKLLAIGLVLTLVSCKTQTNPSGDKVKEDGKSLLWKIEGNGLKFPSYIYGTIHIIPKKDFIMGRHLREVIKKSEKVVFEIDLDMTAALKMAFKSMLGKGKTIDNFLSETQQDTFQVFLEDSLQLNNFEILTYKQLKPIFISEVFVTKALGEAPMSFEMEFKKIADSMKIEITGLETIDEQLKILNKIPMYLQVKLLMETIRNYRKSIQEFQQMVDLYKSHDLEQLYALMEEDDSGIMNYENELLNDRNQKWIPLIEKFIQAQRTFIAVGAAHLAGDNGVIALLQAKGYTITPIYSD
jgi:uncharacterized protein